MSDGPNFTTPDVLPSGQTGWDLDISTRCHARACYRRLRRSGDPRQTAQIHTCLIIQAVTRPTHR